MTSIEIPRGGPSRGGASGGGGGSRSSHGVPIPIYNPPGGSDMPASHHLVGRGGQSGLGVSAPVTVRGGTSSVSNGLGGGSGGGGVSTASSGLNVGLLRRGGGGGGANNDGGNRSSSTSGGGTSLGYSGGASNSLAGAARGGGNASVSKGGGGGGGGTITFNLRGASNSMNAARSVNPTNPLSGGAGRPRRG